MAGGRSEILGDKYVEMCSNCVVNNLKSDPPPLVSIGLTVIVLFFGGWGGTAPLMFRALHCYYLTLFILAL